MAVTVEQVNAALAAIVDPNTGKDLVAGKSVRNVRVDGAEVSVDVELGYPARSQVAPIRRAVIDAIRALPGVSNVSANVYQKIVAHAVQRGVKLLPNVKNVIAVASGKGGVGKSTCTANLGMALAQRNQRVAVVDADFGLRNLDLLLGLENRIVYTALDVLAGDCTVEKALVKDKRQPTLGLLAAAQNRNKEAITPAQMKALVAGLASSNDFILIDCPAGIEMGFQNAIAPAKEAIVVTTPEISAVRDADRVIGLLEANDVKFTKLLINRIKPKMVQEDQMMSVRDVLDILAVPLLGVVPDDERVIVASNRGEPLVLDQELSLAGVAFTNIARRLLGEEVPLIDLNASHDDLFSRLRRFFRG